MDISKMNANIQFSKSFIGSEGMRHIITGLLIDNYDNYEPFRNIAVGCCINVVRGIHKCETDDEDVFPHFNIKLYNYTTRELSNTYHCYINNLRICKITTIVNL